jgi:signal transduction histidine kinase
MKFSAALHAQPKALVVIEAWMLTWIIGVLDYWSGWDVSLFLLYAIPILLLTWFGDRKSATLCAIGCGLAWFAANFQVHNYASTSAYIWAAINRLVYLLFVAIGGDALKRQEQEMRGRMEALIRTRELEQEIVRVSEREQMRIGQDLHDGLCQSLAAIGCAAACLRADLQARGLPETEAAAEIQRLLKDAVVEARNLARGIFPVQMDAEGLPAALEELVTNTNRLRQVPIHFETHGDVKVPDPQLGMHLYRIAQEALSNAIRHAKASRVSVTLDQLDDHLLMSIDDDGDGFAQAGASPGGMGLSTMKYRARLIGADFKVDTARSGGTHVHCSIPITYDCRS